MEIINDRFIQEWVREKGIVSAYKTLSQGLGNQKLDIDYLEGILGISHSLCFALDKVAENPDANDDALNSIPLFSLFYGLFLPLSGMHPTRIRNLFGISYKEPGMDNRLLIHKFLTKQIGLSLIEKIALLMGDPFSGKPANIGQDTMLQILASIRLISPGKLREILPRIGDIGLLFVEDISKVKSDPPISARETMIILKSLPSLALIEKKEVLRDLLERAGRLERYFLSRLILRRLYFGYEYRTSVITEILGACYQVPAKVIDDAVALSDIFEVSRILETQGTQGLTKLILKPLNPVSPALAGINPPDENSPYPLWVECKYDGIRIMAHKDINPWGRVTYAAFTRRKHNWLDVITGLEASLSKIPARSFIIDGEMHGTVNNWETEWTHQASVYEIYRYIQGNTDSVVKLRYIVFDILYLDGIDLTGFPLLHRRKILEQLLLPLKEFQSLVPITVSQGCEVANLAEFQKWYQYFLSQGHEGAIAKIINSPYSMGKRTDHWMKKKKELFLDLVIIGGLWAIGERGPQVFSAYTLACNGKDCLEEIGTTQGLSQQNNWEIIHRLTMDGLITGKSMETRTGSAVRNGIQILPSIVVTVRFEDVVKDSHDVYSLRDPKIVCIRPKGDASLDEVDTYQTIRELYMKRRLG